MSEQNTKLDPVKSSRLLTYLGLESLMMEYEASGNEEGWERVAEHGDDSWLELTDEEMAWINNRSRFVHLVHTLAREMGERAKENEENEDV